MYDDALPVTGGGAVLLGAHTVGLPTIVTAAVAAIAAGLFIYRLATRGRRAQARG